MIVRKEIKDHNELYLYFNDQLIYKRWLNYGYGKVFDKGAWGRYTEKSITDFDLKDTPKMIHVTASLELLSSDKSGRDTPINCGYRPDHVLEYENGEVQYAFMGDIQFDDNISFNPGTTREVIVRFLSHQPIEKYLHYGQKWFIHEGSTLIGTAEMKEIKFLKS